MKERRIHPRLRLTRKVGVTLSSGEVIYLWSHDLSVHGIQVLSEYIADVGDVLRLFLVLPAQNSHEHMRVDISVRVAHVTYSGEHRRYRIGCEITEFQGSGRDLYETWIDNQLLRYGKLQGTG
jgi:hypothetical protein